MLYGHCTNYGSAYLSSLVLCDFVLGVLLALLALAVGASGLGYVDLEGIQLASLSIQSVHGVYRSQGRLKESFSLVLHASHVILFDSIVQASCFPSNTLPTISDANGRAVRNGLSGRELNFEVDAEHRRCSRAVHFRPPDHSM